LNPAGSYNSLTGYNRGDLVSYNGYLYASIVNSNYNNTPSGTTSNTAYWQYIPSNTITVGGSNTQVLYNNAGTVGGSANFVFNGTNAAVGTTIGASRLTVVGGTRTDNITTDTELDYNYNAAAAPLPAPTLNLNFAMSETVDPRITFTRASTATFVGSNGLIQTAQTNIPRIDFNPSTFECLGLLIEESRTNLVLYSAQFDVSANWAAAAGVTISPNTDVSPEGTLTADTMTSSAGNQITQDVLPIANTIYTNSLYYKKTIGATYQPGHYLYFYGGTSVIYVVRLNTDTGAATPITGVGYTAPVSYSVTSVGNYWRLSVTGNSGNNPSGRLTMYPNMTAGGGIAAGSQIIWGAQFEAGAFPTSYIPTVASTVTRSADIASILTSAFPYIQGTGTIVASNQSLPQMTGSFISVASLASGVDENNFTAVGYQGTGATTRLLVINGGSVQADLSPSGASASTSNKLGLAFAPNDFSAVVNGGTVATDSAGSAPVATGLFMGASSAQGISRFSGHIRQITYYPVRATNAQLQALTS
jgi:hypothetical protein